MADALETRAWFVRRLPLKEDSSSSAAALSELSSPSPSAARHSSHSRVAAEAPRGQQPEPRGVLRAPRGRVAARGRPRRPPGPPRASPSARGGGASPRRAPGSTETGRRGRARPRRSCSRACPRRTPRSRPGASPDSPRTTERSFASVARGTRGVSGGRPWCPRAPTGDPALDRARMSFSQTAPPKHAGSSLERSNPVHRRGLEPVGRAPRRSSRAVRPHSTPLRRAARVWPLLDDHGEEA